MITERSQAGHTVQRIRLGKPSPSAEFRALRGLANSVTAPSAGP
ncbi:hypothetical protein HMPREF0043_01184 [Actinobaculum sp. oral taxon 183 str. F0552]|nr:hypothetical protein HMPREF0043_01184 [Actinobaculum sp. oral taxon 183 str. F0552]